MTPQTRAEATRRLPGAPTCTSAMFGAMRAKELVEANRSPLGKGDAERLAKIRAAVSNSPDRYDTTKPKLPTMTDLNGSGGNSSFSCNVKEFIEKLVTCRLKFP